MILVTGDFRIPLENCDAALSAMERVITATRAEPGCIEYAYARDVIEPGLFRIFERWESREALAAHFETLHMKSWQQERTVLGLAVRRVIASSVSDEEIL